MPVDVNMRADVQKLQEEVSTSIAWIETFRSELENQKVWYYCQCTTFE